MKIIRNKRNVGQAVIEFLVLLAIALSIASVSVILMMPAVRTMYTDITTSVIRASPLPTATPVDSLPQRLP